MLRKSVFVFYTPASSIVTYYTNWVKTSWTDSRSGKV